MFPLPGQCTHVKFPADVCKTEGHYRQWPCDSLSRYCGGSGGQRKVSQRSCAESFTNLLPSKLILSTYWSLKQGSLEELCLTMPPSVDGRILHHV